MENKPNSNQDTQQAPAFGTSPNLTPSLKPTAYDGTVLKDRYVLEGELGRGGIGVVYLARDRQLLNRRVVIKVLLQEGEDSALTPWLKKKFEQEVEALVRLDHPGIVGVLDAGTMPDGKLFFVMQFVEGVTLRSLIKNGELLDRTRLASLFRQVGNALSAAHDKGIVHRDLKPENLMVQPLSDGEELIKLIDFGISTVKDSQFATQAERTKVAGAMPYMAPEQLRGRPEASSDIWALGVMAYELLTGHLPFDAETMVQLHESQRTSAFPPPSQWRSDLPEAAEQAILKALSFDPTARQQRAKELGEELARALAAESPAGPSAGWKPGEATTSLAPEIAHVLFLDLVGYSKLPMEEQPRLQRELREIVRGTAEYRRASAESELITLPTGDGMALVFFRDPVAPVRCAIEIARAGKTAPGIRLRTGVHSGAVYRVADINTNRNVAGGGINLAQRVMDCGDAGHILVSASVAETLREFDEWAGWLHDLGAQEVKHGAVVHLFNLYNDEVGNPETPEKLRRAVEPVALPKPAEPPAAVALARRRVPWLLLTALLLAAVGVALWAWQRRPAPPASLPAERTLRYSLQVRLNPAKNPAAEPVKLAGEVIFSAGDELCFVLESPQAGWLYILNEGPEPNGTLPRYNLMFPAPSLPAAATLRPGQRLFLPSEQPPWFRVDREQGTEKLWLVWSDRPVEAFEQARRWLNETDGGEIKDAAEAGRLREFLAQHADARAVAEKGDAQTQLKGGKEGLLLYPVKLEHH